MTATVPRSRPILFSAPMVRANLAGVKTQTRRPITFTSEQEPHLRAFDLYLQPMYGTSPPPNPTKFGTPRLWRIVGPDYPDNEADNVWCPYGAPGDQLWGRETLRRPERPGPGDGWLYAADNAPVELPVGDPRVSEMVAWAHHKQGTSCPSIHMPRWASRLLLDIVDVRAQRLHDINDGDCIAEGCPGGHGAIPGYAYHVTPVEHYRHVWASINGVDSWHANPWVWAITYAVVQPARTTLKEPR